VLRTNKVTANMNLFRVRKSFMFCHSGMSTGRAVNWKKLLFRYNNNPKRREEVSRSSAKINEISSLYFALPKTVEPIDWNFWKNSISTPGIVDKIKAEYDSEMQKQVKFDEEAEKKHYQAFEAEYELAEKEAEKVEKNTETFNREIEILEFEKKNIDKLTTQYFFDKYPGLEEKFEKEQDEGQYFTDPEYEKVFTIDFKELRKQLSLGNVRALSVLSFMPPHDGIDVSSPGYKNVPMEELMKNPQNSPIWQAAQIKSLEKI